MAATIVSCQFHHAEYGGIFNCGGGIYLSMKNGAEELTSAFKLIQLIKGGHTGDTPPPPPPHPNEKIEIKIQCARSLGGKGGLNIRRSTITYVCYLLNMLSHTVQTTC